MTDFSALQDALEQDTSYAAGLSKSMALVLEACDCAIRHT